MQLSMEDGLEIDLNIVAPATEVENDVMQHFDPFNLGPLSEQTSWGNNKGKRSANEDGEDFTRRGVHSKLGECSMIMHTEAEETSLGASLTVPILVEQVKLSPKVVVLLEMKNKEKRFEFLKKRLGMPYIHVVDAQGLSEG